MDRTRPFRPDKLVRPGVRVLMVVAVAALFVAFDPTLPRTAAQQSGSLVNRVIKDADGEHKYAVFVPHKYTPDKKWPVILFLHGAAERGTDGVAQTTVGIGPYVTAHSADFFAFVVFPQCEDTKGRILTAWSPDSSDGKRALAILASVEKEFAIDPHQRILTGWSMGGYGAWNLAASEPKRWSAVIPISGGGDPATAAKLKDVPLWAFHGAKDEVVRIEESRKMIGALSAAGGHPASTEMPDVGHDAWKIVYENNRLYEWMRAPSRAPAERETAGGPELLAHPGARPAIKAEADAPFVPAVAIPQAVSVRLGNDMLTSLAHSVPRMIPADALAGGINDIFDSTVAEGRSFSVQFSRIGYSGQVERAYLKAYRKDRLNIQLALRNVTMSIGTTYVQGSGRSAVAGPINVVIGHRYPVWLSFDVFPYVEKRKLRLQLVGTRFEIPGDNWYVTQPYGVSTSGWGMTEERVSSALVDGIYGQKQRIEQEALSIIPTLLTKLEEKLDLAEVTQVANAFWPLPVYRPRVRVWPQSVEVDKDGVSIVMGLEAAAVDPRKAPATPRLEQPAGISLASVPHETDLRLGVAPGVLEPLSRLLIDADVARVHVLDIPEKTFAAFADRKTLAEAIPDLAGRSGNVEIWSELILTSSIKVRDVEPRTEPEPKTVADRPASPVIAERPQAKVGQPSSPTADPQSIKPQRRFEFVVPKLVISVAIKDDSKAAAWKPYAEFEFELTQQATASVVRHGYSERALRIDWTGEPTVKVAARFAPGGPPANPEIRTDKLRDLFTAGWKAWTGAGPASQVTVPDVDFGYSMLRLSGVAWSPPELSVAFDKPGVKITNASDVDLVYETKGPYSGWSEAYTLKPGKSHEFGIAHPLLFRRKSAADAPQMYTLPVGSHSEFRAPAKGGALGLFRAREAAAGK